VLNRGGHRLEAVRLEADCTAHFNPRVERRSTFRVLAPASGGYLAGRSARVTIATR
jgi:hypothetical protein